MPSKLVISFSCRVLMLVNGTSGITLTADFESGIWKKFYWTADMYVESNFAN